MFNHILTIRMMPFLLLLLAGMGSATSNTLHKYNISGTIYSTSENDVDKVMPDMHIDLMDIDQSNSDDNLGQAVTDGQGHFEVFGEEDEEEEPEPYLRFPIDYCNGVWKAFGPRMTEPITRVWLPSTPEHQNLSIYLGYKNVAYLHRDGQEDLPLKIQQC